MILFAAAALAAELAVPANLDLTGDSAPDAACLKSKLNPDLPLAVELPVGAPATNVALTLVVRGPVEGSGPALRVTLVYADGVERAVRLRWGEDLLTRPAVMKHALPVAIGTDKAGVPVVGVRWTTPTGHDAALARVRVDAPSPLHTMCVAAAVTDAPPIGEITHTDTTRWYPFVHAWDQTAPVPQALPVTAPAGSRGFIRRGDDGHLAWEDGTRARFWGINVVGAPAFPPKEDADAYARTLARLGFNLVRLHHIDQEAPNGVVNPRRGEPGQPELDAEQLDRLDFFVSRLRAHGLHLFLEAATFRNFSPADGVPDWAPGVPNGHKLSTMFLPGWTERYERWFTDFWGRVNPYTGVRYADDPAVVAVELSNEHSILASWGFGIENLPRTHLAALDAEWNRWLRARYKDDAALAAAWKGSPNPGLVGGESLAGGTVAREPRYSATFDRWPTARLTDLYTFYAEVETRFYERLTTHARAMGFRVPIIPSISFDLPHIQVTRDAWGWSDAHYQWDYPRDASITARSALATPEAFLGRLSTAQEGHTVSLSEIGHAAPNPYRAEGPMLWATLASLQDWDMVVWFSWADSAFTREIATLPQGAEVRTAPVMLAQMPTASSAFRAGWIPAASGSLPLAISEDVVRLRTGEELLLRRPDTFQPWSLLEPRTALSQRVRSTFAALPPPVVEAPPVPGVGWWSDPGLLLVDQPTVQVRIGPPGAPGDDGAGIRTISRLEVALDGWAAVSLASGDGAPLAEAKEALLVVATSQESTDQLWAGNGTRIASPGVGPVRVRPARGVVRFAWPRTPTVTTLGSDGTPGASVVVKPVKGRKGWWEVDVSAVLTPWMSVR